MIRVAPDWTLPVPLFASAQLDGTPKIKWLAVPEPSRVSVTSHLRYLALLFMSVVTNDASSVKNGGSTAVLLPIRCLSLITFPVLLSLYSFTPTFIYFPVIYQWFFGFFERHRNWAPLIASFPNHDFSLIIFQFFSCMLETKLNGDKWRCRHTMNLKNQLGILSAMYDAALLTEPALP